MAIEQKNIPFVFVEGGIGCGKSTLVKKLQDYCVENNLKYITIQEPVDEWLKIKDENDKDILASFYENQHEHAFKFQMMAYISRLARLQESYKKAVEDKLDFIICERSLQTDRNVFCKMLYDEGKIDTFGYQIYNKWFEHFQTFMRNIQFVYLRTDFNVCYDRIAKRQRNGENNISKDYLEKNNKYHDDWLLNEEKNVLVLDGNVDGDVDTEVFNRHCKNIVDNLYNNNE
tara:strand:+ start:2029 stop:2718 length:690 start_codon:yes stop_codon:yes gene_type:complete